MMLRQLRIIHRQNLNQLLKQQRKNNDPFSTVAFVARDDKRTGVPPLHSLDVGISQSSQQFSIVTRSTRSFATSTDKEKENDNDSREKEQHKNNEHKESFEDTINRLQGKEQSSSSSSSFSSKNKDDILHNISTYFSSFTQSLSETWNELIHSNEPKDVNKKLYSPDNIHTSKPGNVKDDDNEAADKYKGSVAIMVINEEENLNAYERIQRRLSEAPLIQGEF